MIFCIFKLLFIAQGPIEGCEELVSETLRVPAAFCNHRRINHDKRLP
jgi:hypothetical protein